MQLNLPSKNAVALKLEVGIQLSDKIVSELVCCFPKERPTKNAKIKDQAKIFFFGEDYKVGNKKHYSRGFIWQYTPRDNKYHIIIEYTLEKPIWEDEPLQKIPTLSDLLKCLSKLEKEIKIDVLSNYVYSGKKYQNAIINLPLKLEREEFFNEIRGLRLTKTQDDNVLYSVIVDRPGNADIYCGVTFQYTGLFTTELPDNVFQHSAQIARRAINEI